MNIVPIISEDLLEACAHLYVDVFNNSPWNDNWKETKAIKRLRHFYSTPGFYGISIVDSNKIIGCIFGNVEPYFSGDYYNLREFFISPNRQRQGFGKLLFSELQNTLRRDDIKSIILFTSSKMFPFNFYQKLGFTVDDNLCLMSIENKVEKKLLSSSNKCNGDSVL